MSAVQISDEQLLSVVTSDSLNLKKVLDDMFLVLTDKERDVITRRFSLNNKPKQTLDRIGKFFNVTRERIRQIETIALNKLRRNVGNTKLHYINKLAREILTQNGGVMLDNEIVSDVLNIVNTTSQVDGSIVRLSLRIDPSIDINERTSTFEVYWRDTSIPVATIRNVISVAISHLKKNKKVMNDDQIVAAVKSGQQFKQKIPTDQLILASLSVDRRLKKIDSGWGLMEWRFVNPRSIRDKATIILQKAGKPLHFVEIANKISEVGFDKKVVTVQAVHNELIRYPQFVLVGRGLYALSEWGYQPGTVANVIENLLEKNGAMPKKKIIEEVLKQRKVKVGTISLNLQKNPKFIRVGRAVYDLKENG